MKRGSPVRAALVLTALAFASGLHAQTSTFRFVELAPLPGDTSSAAFSINHQSQVAGYSANADGRRTAVVWTIPAAGASTPPSRTLPHLGGGFSEAYSINDHGDVVGLAATAAGEPHACLWNQHGVAADLHTLFSSNHAVALAVNNVRDIVGYRLGSNFQPQALVIRNGTLENWPLSSMQRATAIDHLRNVVGNGQNTSLNLAYSARTTRAAALPTLAGFPDAEVAALNLLGEKAGTLISESASQAVLWRGDRIAPVSLGTLGGTFSKSMGMNQFYSIVGTAHLSNSAQVAANTATTNTALTTATQPPVFNDLDRAFWWNAGRMFNLNSMTTLPAQWTLQAATAVNDFNEIVGYATAHGQLRAYALVINRKPTLQLRAYPTRAGSSFPHGNPVQFWLCANLKPSSITVKVDGQVVSTHNAIPYPISITGMEPGYHDIEIRASHGSMEFKWQGDFTVLPPPEPPIPSVAASTTSPPSSGTLGTKTTTTLTAPGVLDPLLLIPSTLGHSAPQPATSASTPPPAASDAPPPMEP
jgi:probable HAF family extracellular repeat protein